MSLFLPEFYREIQAKFLDSVIPELKDESININNYESIDDLLSFFELPSDSPLVPSQDVLHLLLTISSRSSSINWSVDLSKSKIGLMETQEQLLASKHTNELLHKSSPTDRCIMILQKYTDAVYNGNEEVYKALQETISQLVTREGARQRSITSISRPGSSPAPKIKEERRFRKRRHNETKESQGSDDTVIIISDSEDDYNDPEYKLSFESHEGSQSTSRDSGQSHGQQLEPSVGIRVFDEPLLRDQFRINEGKFCMWDLINWTFYCSGLSTFRHPRKDSNCHAIYQAHSHTLSFIFDVIEYNLVNTLKDLFDDQDPYVKLFTTSSSQKRFASLQVEDNSNILLTRLLRSIGYLQNQWYDRVVEFVFNGLEKVHGFPKSCYQHETILVRSELKKKGSPSKGEFSYDSDNMESMSLRFKICSLIYYWCMVFDKRIYSGKSFSRSSSTYLNSFEFIKLIWSKLKFIDYRYLVEFYYSSWSKSTIPTKYKQLFLMNLGSWMLKKLTGVSETKFELGDFLSLGEGKYQVYNLDLIVSWIVNRDNYTSITEDETLKTFEEFYQSWMKLNFLFEWMLTLTLGELQDIGNNVYKDPIIYDKLKTADKTRDEAFQEFLISSSLPLEDSKFQFQLSNEFVDNVKNYKMTWEPFTSILSNYT
ncbi:hypothetical protein I9W82_003133 [Candida metapsilosis]|uniref:Uncharacterized protein n=1 Tax=Candida metapsilosis TaxID=273372 RepID=A0A8H7ZG71_9ASCO|nr:hypothetical protein I9W82_003133 [Candida metapsilosis]